MQTSSPTGKSRRRRTEKTNQRSRLEKNKRRHFLIETLERRDHPGAIAEVSGLTLLAPSDHPTPGPVRDLVKLAMDRFPNRSPPHAIEPTRAFGFDAAEDPGSDPGSVAASKQSMPRENGPTDPATSERPSDASLFASSELSSEPPRERQPLLNPLTSAVARSDVFAGSDGDPQADLSTAEEDDLPLVMPVPLGNSIGHGGQLIVVHAAADAQGSVMGSSPTTQRDGGGNGLPDDPGSVPPIAPMPDAGSVALPSNQSSPTPNVSSEPETHDPSIPRAQDLVASVPSEDEVNDELIGLVNGSPGPGPSALVGPAFIQTSTVEHESQSSNENLPEESRSVTICCCGEDPFSDWTTEEFGGTPGGRGQVSFQTDDLVASEGDSLLIELTRSITVPENPSSLSFSFEVHFDTTAQQQINDAFEVALLDADGFSVVPTIDLQRDSYFNLTESVGSRQGASTTFELDSEATTPLGTSGEIHAGSVQLDLSQLAGASDLTLVMRLVNNDADDGSWFRLTCDTKPAEGVDDQFTSLEDTPLSIPSPGVLANDLDLDPATATTMILEDPKNGNVYLAADGAFTYRPDDDFHGTDTFRYTVEQDGRTSEPVTVTIEVTPVIDTRDDDVVTEEDTPVSGDVSINDTYSAPTTIVIHNDAVHGTVIDGGNGEFIYTPEPDFHGFDSFTYAAVDMNGDSETGVVTVEVICIDDTVNDVLTIAEDTPLAGSVAVNDLFADAFTVVIHSDTSHGTITDHGDGAFVYQPAGDFVGEDSFTYTATDAHGNVEEAWATIDVTAVRDTFDDLVTTIEGTQISGNVAINDTHSVPAIFAIHNDAGHGTVTDEGDGMFTYTPDPNFVGQDEFTYATTDVSGATETAHVTVMVTPVGAVVDDAFIVAEDSVIDGNVLTNDTFLSIDALTIGTASHGNIIDSGNGNFTYTPSPDFAGEDSFGYTLVTGGGLTLAGNVTIEVTPVIDTLEDEVVAEEDTPVFGDVSINDTHSASATYLISNDAVHGTLIDDGSGAFTYTPDPDFHGFDSFTYTAVDVSGDSETGVVTVEVTAVNDTFDDTLVTDEGTPISSDVTINDTHSAPTSILINQDAAHGTVTDDGNGAFTYTPDADFTGQDEFSYTATDVNGAAETGRVTVTVTPVGAAVDDSFSVAEDSVIDGNVLTNDTFLSIDTLTFGTASHGSITGTGNGNFTYTPSPDFVGEDSFEYTLVTGGGLTLVGNVTIEVIPVIDTLEDEVVTDEGTPISSDVTINDTHSASTSILINQDAAHGTVTDDGNGAFTYTPDADFTGQDEFSYTATDVNGAAETGRVTVTVTPVGAAVDDSFSVAEDSVIDGNVLTNDTFLSIDTLTFGTASHGSITGTGNGNFTYTPSPDFVGEDSFEYTLVTGGGLTLVGTVTIEVIRVNQPPLAVPDRHEAESGSILRVGPDDGLLGNDTDPDGDPVTVESITSMAPSDAGVIEIQSDGSFVFSAAPRFSGEVTIGYVITDGSMMSTPATLTILVSSPQELAKFYVTDDTGSAVYKYDEAGDSVADQPSFRIDARLRPRGATSNVANDTIWTVTADRVVVVHSAQGSELGRYRIDPSYRGVCLDMMPEGIATDGQSLWVVDAANDFVMFYADATDNREVDLVATDQFPLHPGNRNPTGIATDGSFLYVVENHPVTPRIFVYGVDGSRVGNWRIDVSQGSYDFQGITTNPAGGDELWIVDRERDEVLYFVSGTIHRTGVQTSTSSFALSSGNTDATGIADPPPSRPNFKEWTADQGGDWNDPANWEDGTLPTPDEDVWIDMLGDHSIVISSQVSINSLQTTETIRVQNGILSLAADSSLSSLELNGQLNIAAATTTTIGESFLWNTGTVGGTGNLSLAAGSTSSVSGTSTNQYEYRTLSATLHNEGELTFTGGNYLTLGNRPNDNLALDQTIPGNWINGPGGTVSFEGPTIVQDVYPAYDNNYEPFDSLSSWVNEGLIRFDERTPTPSVSTTARLTVPWTNSGQIEVLRGGVMMSGRASVSGSITIAEDATLRMNSQQRGDGTGGSYDEFFTVSDDISPTITLTRDATIAGGGTLQLQDGVIDLLGNVDVHRIEVLGGQTDFRGVVQTDEVKISQGQARFLNDMSLPSLILSGGEWQGSGDLEITESMSWTGGEFGGEGSAVLVAAATATLAGYGLKSLKRDLVSEGALTFDGGTLLLGDLDGSVLTLAGTTIWDSGSLSVVPGSVINQSGTLDVIGWGSISPWTDPNDYGTPQISDTLFSNRGSVHHAGNGDFSINTQFENYGIVRVDPNRTLHLGDGTAVIQHDGSLQIDDGTVSVRSGGYGSDQGSMGLLQVRKGDLIATGTLNSSLELHSDLRLGSAPGILRVRGDLEVADNGRVHFNVAGLNPGIQHDQIQVDGRIELAGELDISRDYESVISDTVVLIKNANSDNDLDTGQSNILDPIVGRFADKDEWQPWSLDGHWFRLTYQGVKDTDIGYRGPLGNDVVLHHTGVGVIINDFQHPEGHDNEVVFRIPVKLDALPKFQTTVDYVTVPGHAEAGIHYQSVAGTLTFVPGELEKFISIPIFGDRQPDPAVDFAVHLSAPDGGILLRGDAQVNILNDDYSGLPDSLGIEFWFAVPENYTSNTHLTNQWRLENETSQGFEPDGYVWTENLQGFFVNLTSEDGATGTILAPGIGYSEEFTIAAGETIQIRIPDELEPYGFTDIDGGIATEGQTDRVYPHGIRITADSEIAAYGMALQQYSTDGFLVLPTDVIGTEYILTSQESFFPHRFYVGNAAVGHSSGSQFQVIGTVDNTVVEIRPTAGFDRYLGYEDQGYFDEAPEVLPSETYEVILNRGDVYSLRATRPDSDFTGTHIRANLPVSVLTGSTCTNVPVGFAACDILVEQVPPLSTWGTEFVVNPLESRNVDRVRMVASQDDTVVAFGESLVYLNRGEYEEFDLRTPVLIDANHPIQVAHFSTGQDYRGEAGDLVATAGDPAMVLIPPSQQFLTKYTVTTNIDRNNDNFISLVVPDGITGDVTINGDPVDPNEFSAVVGSDYSVATLNVDDGSYALQAPLPFGVTSYGFSNFESYAYLGGQSFVPLDVSATLDLTPETSQRMLGERQTLTARVTDDQGQPFAGVRVDFVVEGVHDQVGSARTDINGIATLEINGILTGDDNVTAMAIGRSDTSAISWIGGSPSIEIVSPEFGYQTDAGTTVLVSGVVDSGSPEARVVSVYVDGAIIDGVPSQGQTIETVDAAGNFFTSVELPWGHSSYTFTVVNSFGHSATTTLDLNGIHAQEVGPVFDSLIDISSVVEFYARTSFDDRTDTLYADTTIRNSGNYPIGKPVYVGIRNLADPTVIPLGTTGHWRDGTPFYDLSDLVIGSQLDAGASTETTTIAFEVPSRSRFTYELVLLGGENREPVFESLPVLRARGGLGKSYNATITADDPDGDVVDYSILSGPAGLQISTAFDGSASLRWTNIPAASASYPVTLQADDRRGGVATQSFVISVSDSVLNRPSLFSSTPVLDAFVGTDYVYDADARDADGDSLSYSISVIRVGDATQTQLAGSHVTIGPDTGRILWQPSAADVGDYDVIVSTSDDRGGLASQHYTLTVGARIGNFPPVFTSTPTTKVAAGASYTYQVTAVDPDLDDLSYKMAVDDSAGVSITPNGLLTFDVPASTTADYPITVLVDDGNGNRVPQSFVLVATDTTPVTLTGRVYEDVDDSGTYSAGADNAMSGWTVYLDTNSNFRFDVGETNVVTDNDGNYSVNSLAGADYRVGIVRDDAFVTITPDGKVHEGTGTAGQSVGGLDFRVSRRSPVNSSPVITTNPPATAALLQPFVYDVDATDADGDDLTFQLLSDIPDMTIDPVSGVIRWLPLVGEEELVKDIVVRVSDGRGGSDRQLFWPEFSFDNAAPEITSKPSASAAVAIAYNYQVEAIDPDGDVLTYSLDPASQIRGASIDVHTGMLTWNDPTTGQHDFEVTVTDSRGAHAVQSFTLPVLADAFPVFEMPERISTPLGTPIQLHAKVADPLGDPVTIVLSPESIQLGAELQSIDVTGDTIAEPTLVFDPPAGREFPITLLAHDPAGHSVTWTVVIDAYVTSENNLRPTITSVPAPVLRRDMPASFFVSATDPHRDDIRFSLADAPSSMAIDSFTGEITWQPTAAGNFDFTVIADDGSGGTDQRTITLTVLDNAPPRFTSTPSRNATVGNAYQYDLDGSAEAVDPNPDETSRLTFRAEISPTFTSFGNDPRLWPDVDATIDPISGLLSWTPSAAGDYFVALVATDPSGEIATQAYFVSVTAPGANHAPDLLDSPSPRPIISPRVQLDYQAAAKDVDNDPLTFVLINGPAGMTVTSQGRVQYTPTENELGTSGTFTLSVSDGRGGTDSREFGYTVSLDASSNNRSPQFTSIPRLHARAGSPYVYHADAIDLDGDRLTYELTEGPAGMSIAATTGLIQWNPTVQALGEHSVVITATDIAGAATPQPYTIRIVRGDVPPQITSSPAVESRAGDFYRYGINATDADGDAIEFYLGAGTSANFPLQLDPLTGVLSGTTDIATTYDVEIIAIDPTDRFDTQTFPLTVKPESNDHLGDGGTFPLPDNVPPTITTQPGLTTSALESYVYQFDAIDPDLVRSDTLSWSLPISINPPPENDFVIDEVNQTLTWIPTVDEIGEQFDLRLQVNDGSGAYSYQDWTLRVTPQNQAPTLDPIADQTIAAGARLALDVVGDDPNDDRLTYTLDQASLDRGVTIDELGRLRWQTTIDDLPDSPVGITVDLSDGKLSAASPRTFVVSLTPDQMPPTVGLTSSRVMVEAGNFFDLSVSASDNVGLEGRTLQLVSITDFQNNTTTLDQPLTLNDAGLARFTADESQLGLLRFVATATDTSGLIATSSIVEVLVLDPDDTTRPQVQIISPLTDDDSVGPADIIGSVHDDGAGVSWKLEISSVDDSGVSRNLAEGIGTFTADVIGLFDPTMLAEGSYALTLSAVDAGSNTDSDTVILDVGRDFKLGNFSLSFTDLEIPVAGIPITIIRSYDTLDAKASGDFGYGWDLEIVQPELRVVQGSTGPNGLGSRYPTFVNGTRVMVTTPEGAEEGFTVNWVPSQIGSFLSFTPYYRPSFVPDPGNQYSLSPPGADMAFSRLTENGSYTLAGDTREYSAMDPSFGNAYLLTESGSSTKGLTYTINATTGTGSRVTDKYGNELQYRDDGIFSNRGRDVTFTRDWRGRITSITDPAGGVLTYQYDGRGRLVAFYDRLATERLTDEVPGNEFSPTRFEYDPDFTDTPIEGLDNYLTRIIDPLSVTALETRYDPETGRLIALLDAEGNASTLNYQLAADESTLTSQSTGNSSSSSFDGAGRLIRETNQSGQTSVLIYVGDSRYPYQTIQVVGDPDGADAWADRSGDDRVTTRQYHAEFDGAVTEEVDPDGNRTVTAYNTWGFDRGTPDAIYGPDGSVTDYHWFDLTGDGGLNLASTTDQDGNVTSYSYDTRGNITSVVQSNAGVNLLGAASSFVYDDFGDLIQVVDADGNLRQISYDENGRQTGTTFYHYSTDQRPPVLDEAMSPVTLGYTVDDFPSTRIRLETFNFLNAAGDVMTSRTEVMPQTINAATLSYEDDLAESETRNAEGATEYDALGRAFRTTDGNGRVSETLYDSRGLTVQTRTESPDEGGNGVWLISNTVYDADGRAVYSTDSFPEGTPVSEITGTHTVYDTATGRVIQSQQLLGLDIAVTPSSSLATHASSLRSTGTVLSFSSTIYDDRDRVVETSNDHGLRSQTLYDENGRVIESRSEVVDTSGPTPVKNWLVSRTLYDTDGKVLASTDQFFVPEGTPLGNDPTDPLTGRTEPVQTRITKTIYDDRDRTIATERYEGGSLSLTGTFDPSGTDYHPGFTLSTGVLASVSETLFDAAGRVWRTISGRVPESTLSPIALAQSQALADFAIHGEGADPYAGQGLSSGTLSDSLFDTRGRQFGSLGHPLPAADVGLSGGDYDGNLVRPRTETIYNAYGQAAVQRSGLVHVVSPTDVFVSVRDNRSIDMVSHFDAFGNVIRTDYVTGGSLSSLFPLQASHVREAGVVRSYTQTRFDVENRPVAEMQQTDGSVVSVWSVAENSFVFDGTTTPIPTKLFHYDSDDRLEGVSLPAVADPENSSSLIRPKYEYGYDELGNQTLIVDPVGHETRFTFTDRGQPKTRTLPLGFGEDGIFETTDDALANSFTESFTYDDQGRQHRHTSFEGVVTENVYDSFGRMSAVNYYTNDSDQMSGLISQRDEYSFDDHGRRDSFTRYTTSEPTALAAGTSASTVNAFTQSRFEQTVYDSRGRIIAETSDEGVLRYTYDEQGRMTSTAVADSLIGSASRVTHYGYDLLGRLVNVTEDATPGDPIDDPQIDTDYTFDLQGRARTVFNSTQVTLPSLMTVYQYDALGRLDTLTDYQVPANRFPVNLQLDDLDAIASYDYTVRGDGKRTAVDETLWIDADEDGVQDPGELKTTSTAWTYDSMGRLTDEVIDHWDDTFDQTESYAYDLTGNRIGLDRDLGNDSSIDESIDYRYDANDRLFAELSDTVSADTTTVYRYDHTQQTAKTVYTGLLDESTIDALVGGGDDSSKQRVSLQSFRYNLQGRMSQAIVDAYDSSGELETRTRSTYEYDLRKFRVGNRVSTWNQSTSQFEFTGDTEYLVSHSNHTGYAQTLRETTTHADGSTKTVDYTFGNDEISQRTVERDDQGTTTSDQTLLFGHDGHGSVRALYDLAVTGQSTIEAIATYSAYGLLVATHSGKGIPLPVSINLLTTLTYSGEAWDSHLQQGYHRARWYDANSAQWNRLDPFSGNPQDPQSLHKYAYVHGDPVQGVDPNGLFKSGLAGSLTTIGIGTTTAALAGGAVAAGSSKSGVAIAGTVGASIAAITVFAPWAAIGIATALAFDGLILSKLTDRSAGVSPVSGRKLAEGIEYGHLASIAYQATPNPPLSNGWVHVRDHRHQNANNYNAREFFNSARNEVVLAFAGTDDIPDVITDVFQGTFGGGTDYGLAIRDAQQVIMDAISTRGPGVRFRFVGHSLGGGMAAAAAAVTGYEATTFNAAGLNNRTVAQHGVTQSGIYDLYDQIDAFRVAGEFLSLIQDSVSITGFVMPDGNGHEYWVPGDGNMFSRHKMGVMLKRMNNLLHA